MLIFSMRMRRFVFSRLLPTDTVSLDRGGRRAVRHCRKCAGFQLFSEMNEDLLLRGNQRGELLNVRSQSGNLILLPDHAGPEFGHFFRLNKSRCRGGMMLQDRDLRSQRALCFLDSLTRHALPDVILLNRGVLHRLIG